MWYESSQSENSKNYFEVLNHHSSCFKFLSPLQGEPFWVLGKHGSVAYLSWNLPFIPDLAFIALQLLAFIIGTCEASWFDSISNRTSDSRFDSYWWSHSKFLNRPRCQSSFVKKRLVVVKFAFKVDFGSKISVQQHCLTRFMTELK